MRTLLILLSCFLYINLSAQKNSKLYFPFASSQVTEDARQQISTLIKELKTDPPSEIIINGYTDRTGSEQYNKGLSADRAQSVLSLLKEFLPSETKITINSYGANDPISDKEEEQHLNRRVEIFITASPLKPTPDKEEQVVQVQPFVEDVAEQHFKINLDDTVKVRAKEGTFIKIDPGSIQSKQGKLAGGEAVLIIKEYFDPSKILLAGLNSFSDEGLLQTGGMIAITIMQAGETMDAVTKKPVLIRLPQRNESLNNMSVYTIASPMGDTTSNAGSLWNNTNNPFRPIRSFWQTPSLSKVLRDVNFENDIVYTNMRIGAKYEDEYYTAGTLFIFKKTEKPFARKIFTSRHKKDAGTIQMRVKIKFRGRGYRTFRKRNLDTTFTIDFIGAEYEGVTTKMNLINCDRFYNSGETINQYVKTPGVSGVAVIAYFKNISSFLPAAKTDAGYSVEKIPKNMPVTFVAIGKKGSDFYFGKKEYITDAQSPCEIDVVKMTEEDFRKEMKTL